MKSSKTNSTTSNLADKRSNDVVSGSRNDLYAAMAGEGPGPELAGESDDSNDDPNDQVSSEISSKQPSTEEKDRSRGTRDSANF